MDIINSYEKVKEGRPAVLHGNIPRYLVTAFLGFTLLATFVPLNPAMPASGLDSSWVFALNEAVARGMVFGKNIVFSYGPYASVKTHTYDPATDHLMLFGSGLVGICYFFALLLLVKGRKLYWLLIYAIFLPFAYISDSFFFCYPLVLAFITYRITLPDGRSAKISISKPAMLGVFALFIPLGLLPLVKVSLVAICVPIAFLCFVMLLRRGPWKKSAVCALIFPGIAAVLFWMLSGQPLFAVPAFFVKSFSIMSGYTEAMALPGNVKEILFFLFAAGFFLYATNLSDRNDPMISRLFLLLACGLFLFISFKEGFVRHDSHAIIAGSAILMASLLINLVFDGKLLIGVFVVSMLPFGYIYGQYHNADPSSLYKHMKNTYCSVFDGVRLRLRSPGELNKRFHESIQAIEKQYRIPRLNGTADIYPYDISYLLASGNGWSPRPVFQSYSAYTPLLERLNERHLLSRNSPDNILFSVKPIDGRLPVLEDGLSWPVLLNDYSVRGFDGKFAYLRKNPAREKGRLVVELERGRHKLGDEITVPDGNNPLFAKVRISPTVLGRLMAILFKLPSLRISLSLQNGSTRDFGFIPGMGGSGFLLSPLVQNTKDFVLLSGDSKYLAMDKVRSFTLYSRHSWGAVFWHDTFNVELMAVNMPHSTDISRIGLFDGERPTKYLNLRP